jgi:serine/threonine-protein kinase
MGRSHGTVPEDAKLGPKRRSEREFLNALERSRVLPDGQWQSVQDRFGPGSDDEDSLDLARKLIREGTLTVFQARRLSTGKKSLEFGRYALIDHIGQGARGRVFKARHRLMDRVVALKVYMPDDSLSKNALGRFFREMKIVALLDHPNVVRAIDADVHDGCPYIVMEYLEGDDLEHVFARRGPLPEDEVIAFMAQAARGLAHAHEMGVIHRDVKPTNMFLVKDEAVKLLDLGFGELVGMEVKSGNVFDTDEGIVVGTTDFMSPEQVLRKPIDVRTDLFSLGCTMYRLLTGSYAFPGVTREDRLIKRIREGHVPITEVRPGLSYRLVKVVDRLLALEPEDRFGSAAEAAEALEALLPPTGRPAHGTGANPRGKRPGGGLASAPAEPEAPLDWSVIESALRPSSPPAGKTPRLIDREEPKPPSAQGLSSHRKGLEADGIETGREAHEKYRNELIQMNRVMAELQSMGPKDEGPAETTTWLERIGEKIGDSLAEPSAGQILIAILAVILILALALAAALG